MALWTLDNQYSACNQVVIYFFATSAMKASISISAAILILLSLASCTKEEDVKLERINPDAYFPAYPGSYWDYDTTVWKISDCYVKLQGYSLPFFEQAGYHVFRSSLMHLVYAGHGQAGTATSSIIPPGSRSFCPISFVSFELSSVGGMGSDTNDIAYRRGTVVEDTSIIVLNKTYSDVKIVKEWSVFDTTHLYFDYFAKDIGLIKREKAIDADPGQIVTILELHSFHINK